MTTENINQNAPEKKDDSNEKKQDLGLSSRPDDNVDQEGHCVNPAYAESVNLNTGAPCDDGRDGE